jgi:hypothetical protein
MIAVRMMNRMYVMQQPWASLTCPRFTAESEWRADSSIGIAIGKRMAIVAERRLEASADIAMRCGHDDFAGSAI